MAQGLDSSTADMQGPGSVPGRELDPHMPWGGGGKRLFYYEEKRKNCPRLRGKGSWAFVPLPAPALPGCDTGQGLRQRGRGSRHVGQVVLHAAHPRGCRLVG